MERIPRLLHLLMTVPLTLRDLHGLLDKQLQGGVWGCTLADNRGIPTLSKEHLEVFETVEQVKRQVPVIWELEQARLKKPFYLTQADELGADAFLLVFPYYNKPSQESLLAHFWEARGNHRKTHCVILHSLSLRNRDFNNTVQKLREKYPSGLKGSWRRSWVSETLCSLDDDFVVLSGDDGLHAFRLSPAVQKE